MRLVVGVGFLACGCTQDLVGDRASALVGATPTYQYPSVLLLENPDGGYCSGSLIAADVVLTAAHCQMQPGAVATVMAYDQRMASETVAEVVFHRYHNGGDAFADHDLSLLHLAGPLAEEPVPFVVAPLPDTAIGQTLTVVGLGVIDGSDHSGGQVKRVADFPVSDENRDYLTGGTDGTSICYGDSGGPAFLDIDGVATQVGVTRSHYRDCTGLSQWTRVDTYAGEFVIPFLDSWSGPCRLDGTCVTDGCRTADPDCAPCGVDGVCSTGCPEIDLDCPVAGFLTDPCASDDDCESRRCIEDPYGVVGRYCTSECDSYPGCTLDTECQEQDGARLCLIPPAQEPDEGGGCAVAADEQPLGLVALLVSCLACSRGPRRRRRCPGTP